MTDQDPLSHINPLLRTLVEAITIEMAGAFEELWTRPDAAEQLDAFMDRRVGYLVTRAGVHVVPLVDGVQVVEVPPGPTG
jgi:hypothetical protein